MKTWLSLGISVGVISLFMACTIEETELVPDGTGGSTASSSSSSSGSTSTSSSTSSTGSSSSSSGNTGCGDLEWSTDAACNGCMETNCCSQLADCASGTPCGQLFDCLEACANDDQPCIDACMATHGAGLPAAQSLVGCSDGCADVCGATGICDTELGYESEVLNQCLTDNCCTTYLACYNDLDCNACLTGQHPNPADCEDDTLAVGQLFLPYMTCFDDSCPTSFCGSGIGFYIDGVDPVIECNACLATAVSADPTVTCCDLMATCLGPDPANPDTDLCIACLNADSTGCTNGSDEWNAAATFINECVDGTCATDCG